MLTRRCSTLAESSTAVYSDDLVYRYRLWRVWDERLPSICFLMLNPSTATEEENDPTLARCQTRAVRMGYGRMDVVNLFAFRSTDPEALYDLPDPVGPDNDGAILDACEGADLVVCGWGEHGAFRDRSRLVRQMLSAAGISLTALAINQSGEPQHPLYLAYARGPMPFPEPAEA